MMCELQNMQIHKYKIKSTTTTTTTTKTKTTTNRSRRTTTTIGDAFTRYVLLALCTFALLRCNLCSAYDDDGFGVGVGGAAIAKVNCIAHDTKFTCNCGTSSERMVLPRLTGFVYQVEISNCSSLLIEANTFDEVQGLRRITIQSVNALVLERYALAFPLQVSNTPLIIEFHEVNFQLIDSHAISGNIEEISFIGGHIENFKPFGFTTLKERGALLLKMERVNVQHIEPQAFKKFSVENLEILNCHFASNVPSKVFYDLEVTNAFIMQGNRFKTVHTRAFSFQLTTKLSIVQNRFESVDAEWIETNVRETVSIRDNQFGTVSEISFRGIGVHRDYKSSEPLHLQFINNHVQFPLEPRPLEFNVRFLLIIQLVYYQNEFSCKYAEQFKQQTTPTNDAGIIVTTTIDENSPWLFFQKYSDNIYFLHSTTTTSTSSTVGTTTSRGQSYALLSSIIEIDCKEPIIWPYILAGVLVLLLILLIIALAIFLYCKKKRKNRKMDVVMPDPRTYTQTEIVYKIETAGLIRTDF